jgi:hypothetical protein
MCAALKAPLHERWRTLGLVRGKLREHFFRVMHQAARTDDAKSIVSEMMSGLVKGRPDLPGGGRIPAPPYPALGRPLPDQTARRADPVFITGRFRSGSTLLWNLFRNVEGCTAYYEPHNERRWFDPRMRGTHTDSTHRGVSEYWREYEGLEELGEYYREEWVDHDLSMGPDFWDPRMRRFIEILIERAPGRPIMQFNHVDFRLPWLRRNFPNATIIHLYRHPRDQWCSSLMGDVRRFPRDGDVTDFMPYDHFYLLRWARDLKYAFPFLDEKFTSQPYRLFYYIWRLSYVFGVSYSDHSLAFERIVDEPRRVLTELFGSIGLDRYDLAKVESLIAKPALNRWEELANDDWFRRHEMACETVLDEFFNPYVIARRDGPPPAEYLLSSPPASG